VPLPTRKRQLGSTLTWFGCLFSFFPQFTVAFDENFIEQHDSFKLSESIEIEKLQHQTIVRTVLA